jgi:hypothetical protein
VGLVTPVPVRLARELVESLVNTAVVTDRRAVQTFSNKPLGLTEAIRRSLTATRSGEVPTSFVDVDLVYFAPAPTDPAWSGGTVLTDIRTATSSADPGNVFSACSLSGGQGLVRQPAPLADPWRTRPSRRRARTAARSARFGQPRCG